MLGFGRRPPKLELVSGWCKLIENLSFSPMEFYANVQKALAQREIPKLADEVIDIHEGGTLSAKRAYLRLKRERVVIDVCGAPFGTGFFVSWRLLEKPLRLHWLVLLVGIPLAVVMIILGLVAWAYVFWFGSMIFSLFVAVLIVTVFLIRHDLVEWMEPALRDLDASLLDTPIIGSFYERFFRVMTYYRADLAAMFQQAVHAAVMQAVDEMTKVKGLPALGDSDRKPLFGDLFRR